MSAITGEEKERGTREYSVVGVDEAAPLLRSLSSAQALNLGQLSEAQAGLGVELNADGICPQGAPPDHLAVDPVEHGQAALLDEGVSNHFTQPLAEPESDRDDLDGLFVKVGLDAQGEIR